MKLKGLELVFIRRDYINCYLMQKQLGKGPNNNIVLGTLNTVHIPKFIGDDSYYEQSYSQLIVLSFSLSVQRPVYHILIYERPVA